MTTDSITSFYMLTSDNLLFVVSYWDFLSLQSYYDGYAEISEQQRDIILKEKKIMNIMQIIVVTFTRKHCKKWYDVT